MTFDLERPWGLDRQVALRPEPFGALAYHFGSVMTNGAAVKSIF